MLYFQGHCFHHPLTVGQLEIRRRLVLHCRIDVHHESTHILPRLLTTIWHCTKQLLVTIYIQLSQNSLPGLGCWLCCEFGGCG